MDRAQQRYPWLSFPVAVLVKYADDSAGGLAAQIAYYSFFALFPLFLLLVTVLDLVLRHTPGLQHQVLHSALGTFPVIGPQLTRNVQGLQRTGVGVIVGVIGTVFGARGLAATCQRAFDELWDVPHVDRPMFPKSWLRQAALLAVLAVGVGVTGTLSGFGSGTIGVGALERAGALLLSMLVNVGLFILGFRVGTARAVPTRDLATSATAAALSWQLLLTAGSYVVAHELRHASALYGLFGLVLGLLAWLHLQAQVMIVAIETDVVRARGLWPRSLMAPPRTSADEAALRGYADMQRRQPDQTVDVGFGRSTER